MFWMLTLWSYVSYVDRSKVQSSKSKIYYGLALLFFVLGLMSKPMLVTLPFVLLLLDFWPLRRIKGFALPGSELKAAGKTHSTYPNPNLQSSTFLRLVAEKIPFFVLAAASSAITFVVQRAAAATSTLETVPLGARVGNALISYCRYLGKLLFPVKLGILYPHPVYWPTEWVILAGLLLFGFTAFVAMAWRQRPYLFVGWFWFLGTLVPVIGLVQVGMQSMADRYSYVPFVGLFVILVWGACDLVRNRAGGTVMLSMAAGAALLSCVMLTHGQIGYWKNPETLFRHAVEVTPNNHIAHENLGVCLENDGLFDEAIEHFQAAATQDTNSVNAFCEWGHALTRVGRFDEAISRYQQAIKVNPEFASAYNGLGNCLQRVGRLDEAIEQYQTAIKLKTNYAEACYNLGRVLATEERFDEAISRYREAIAYQPGLIPPYNNLGLLLAGRGRTDEAIAVFQEAIKRDRNFFPACYNLGNVLSDKGRLEEAIGYYQQALTIQPDNSAAHNSLAKALRQIDRLDEAIAHYRKALEIQPDLSNAREGLDAALLQKAQPGSGAPTRVPK